MDNHIAIVVHVLKYPILPDENDFTAIFKQELGPFSNTQRQHCFFVEINDDVIPEGLENLFLYLTADSGEVLQRVDVNATRAEVTINDNDREFTQYTIIYWYSVKCCMELLLQFADDKGVRMIYLSFRLVRLLVQYQWALKNLLQGHSICFSRVG